MKWRKLGRMFVPNGEREWMASHAACPVPQQVDKDRHRFYFTSRDAHNRSVIASLEVDIREPQRVLALGSQPLLQRGSAGTFDDNGVSVGCVVVLPDETRLYYMGWTIRSPTIWENAIGVCRYADGGEGFRRHADPPILGRNPHDPQSLTYPWVLRDGPQWLMWYGSHLRAVEQRDEIRHVLKMAHSQDGISWVTNDEIVVDLVGSDFAVTKPCVLRDKDRWRMWFSRCRGDEYRMGYAESVDGRTWQCCDDEVGIHPSVDGWDSHSVEYGCVFDCRGERYMVYNGRDYGRTGFGLAVLEQD